MKKIKAYLIGKNIKKSFSKDIYLCLFSNIDYSIKNFQEENDLFLFLEEKKFDFINITIPYKRSVIPFLDKISPTVKATNVCNLIINRGGVLCGYNTDVCGFKDSLKRNQIETENKTVLILGNGATSTSIKYALSKLNTKEIVVAARNPKENEVSFENIKKDNIQIVINATPIGRKENERLVNLNEFPKLEMFVDCIYAPYRTSHMIDAKACGKGFVNGIEMLISQAMMNYSFYSGQFVPEIIRQSIKASILLDQVNLVLIGLPTSGKTKACKELKKLLNKKNSNAFFDTDEIIEKSLKMSIYDIFKYIGEEEFRKIETQVCKPLSSYEGAIISTGGGLVMNEKNYKLLSKNGFFIYLKKTNFDDYVPDKKRPLIKCKGDLIRLYRERNPIYEKIADLTISSNSSAKEIIEEACSAITNS